LLFYVKYIKIPLIAAPKEMSFVETTLASLMMGTIKVVSGQVLIKLVSV
jgi:hypothetical protein